MNGLKLITRLSRFNNTKLALQPDLIFINTHYIKKSDDELLKIYMKSKKKCNHKMYAISRSILENRGYQFED